MRRPRSQSWVDYFWSRVDRSSGPDACWPFTGATNADGYGVIRLPPKNGKGQGPLAYTHRVAIVCGFGAIPGRRLLDGQEGRHSNFCTTRSCSNPAHLLPGSHQDNVEDRMAKKKGKCFGGAGAQLTMEDLISGHNGNGKPERAATRSEHGTGDQQAGGGAGDAPGAEAAPDSL